MDAGEAAKLYLHAEIETHTSVFLRKNYFSKSNRSYGYIMYAVFADLRWCLQYKEIVRGHKGYKGTFDLNLIIFLESNSMRLIYVSKR